MGFQTRVNQQPAPAVAGDFAGTNPRTSVTAPPGGYTVAPDYPASFGGALANALIVGRFSWANYLTGLMANYFQPASLLGFVHRESQSVITAFLDESRVAVQEGFPVTAHNQGDFWADFALSAPDAAGLVVYADPVTGQATADVTGQGVTVTGFNGAVSTAGLLTVTGAGTGTFAVGQIVADAAGLIPPGSYITALVSGTGGTGTYQLNQAPAVAVSAAAFTAYGKIETRWKLATPVAGTQSFTGALAGTAGATFTGVVSANVLTVSALTGVLHSGDLISGAGVASVPLGRQITGFPGSVGTYHFTHGDVGSEAMTSTNTADGVLAVSALSGGPIVPPVQFAGAGVPVNALITGQLTGAVGSNGNYQTNLFQLIGSEAMTAAGGTLGKISTWQA